MTKKEVKNIHTELFKRTPDKDNLKHVKSDIEEKLTMITAGQRSLYNT